VRFPSASAFSNCWMALSRCPGIFLPDLSVGLRPGGPRANRGDPSAGGNRGGRPPREFEVSVQIGGGGRKTVENFSFSIGALAKRLAWQAPTTNSQGIACLYFYMWTKL